MAQDKQVDPAGIAFIGFPGLIGLKGGIPISAPSNLAYDSHPVFGWAQAIMDASGQTAGREPIAYDDLVHVMAGHLDSVREQGVFALPVPTPGDRGVLARYLDAGLKKATADISSGRTQWTAEMRDSQKAAIEAWRQLPQKVKINNADASDGVWFLGPLSDSVISKTAGNNVIYASPVMYQSLWRLSEEDSILFSGYDYQYTMTGFFPSSQGKYQSNELKLGDGNDIVYFDSSFKTVRAGDGDNTFVPSFGSFNWAFLSLAPPYPQAESFTNTLLRHPASFNQSIFLVNPVPLVKDVRESYGTEDIYGLAMQVFWKADTDTIQGRQVYYGGKPSAANNTDNRIGGQTLIGGKGSDTFYGVDPAFYAAVDTQVLQGRYGQSDFHIDRYVFRDPAGDTKNQRFNIQKFETVRMFGGDGSDVFYLGNPNHITPDGLNFTGASTYILAGSHYEDSPEAARRSLNWAKHDNAPNTYVINLSNDIRSYTNTSSSFDAKTKKPLGPLDYVQGGFELVLKMGEFLQKSELGKIPYVAAVSAGIKLGVGLYEAASTVVKAIYQAIKPDPDPIVLTSEQLSAPLGNWKHQVQISDWSPSDVIRIVVDTTYGGAQYKEAQNARWKNIEMVIQPSDLSSETGLGTSIAWKTGVANQPIVRLDYLTTGEKTPSFGYAAYDYTLGRQVWLSAQHLDFFGNIALGVEGIEPLKNYTASNGFVFSSSTPGVASASPDGSYLFYWNDKRALGDQGLDDARQKSSAITVEFDSRKLGWYWQPVIKLPQVVSDNPQEILSAVELDPQASRLWILGPQGQWGYHSFSQFDTQVPAMIDALRATTFYQVMYRGEIEKPAGQIASEKMIESLTHLKGYVSDLGKLKQGAPAGQEIASLQEVMFVTPAQTGHELYYAKNGQALTVTLSRSGSEAIASAPRVLGRDEQISLEKAFGVDLTGDGLIGDFHEVLALAGRPGLKVTNSYVSLLDRLPTEAEMAESVARLDSASNGLVLEDAAKLAQIKREIVQSAEYLDRFSSLGEFVSDLHHDLLGSSPAVAEDLPYWQSLQDAGFSRADIAWIYSNASEFTQRLESEEVLASLVGTVPDLA